MTQIKNINAMQELTEVQEDMADTHDKFHNKSLKGKKDTSPLHERRRECSSAVMEKAA